MNDIEQAAAALRHARAWRQPIPRVSETFGIAGADAAYTVQRINAQLGLEQGRVVSGRKIGLTSVAVQQQLGVDEPDFGILFADMELHSGAEVPMSTLIQPKAEGEVAFVLGTDLPEDGLTWGRFVRAVEYALPAIEVVDSAIEGWKLTLVDTIADNASCGLYVLGLEPRRVADLDLLGATMEFRRNGDGASSGSGALCLGHPLRAAHWLAQRMLALGEPMKAGDVIMSGALGPMVPLVRGDRIDVHISGLGRVSCQASD